MTRELHSSKSHALDGGIDLYFFAIRCLKRGNNRPFVWSISPDNYRPGIQSATLLLKTSRALFIEFSVTSIFSHIQCFRVFSQITISPRATTRKGKKVGHHPCSMSPPGYWPGVQSANHSKSWGFTTVFPQVRFQACLKFVIIFDTGITFLEVPRTGRRQRFIFLCNKMSEKGKQSTLCLIDFSGQLPAWNSVSNPPSQKFWGSFHPVFGHINSYPY